VSEVTELIADLRAGRLSLDQVAQRFRDRRWPEASYEDAPDLDLASRALDDPEPYVPGSFDDVSAALHRQELTLDQYEVLARAAAESINCSRPIRFDNRGRRPS
jgi:hypothetical protein